MEKKVVLITGCSSGIGRKLCMILKRKGYFVAASARELFRLDHLDADMKVMLDVSRPETIENAVKEIIERSGRIDILVNNAGYSFRAAVEEIDLDEMKKMYDVNVYGIIRMMQAVLPYMRKQKCGKILNIGSVSGRLTGMLNGSYCASKHAVEAITEAARYELREFGISVTVVEPGAMDTDFFDTLEHNSELQMKNTISPYHSLYQRDIKSRKRQKRASAEKSAERIAGIIEKRRWKVRYTVSLPVIFSVLVRLPDRLKEVLILKFG